MYGWAFAFHRMCAVADPACPVSAPPAWTCKMVAIAHTVPQHQWSEHQFARRAAGSLARARRKYPDQDVDLAFVLAVFLVECEPAGNA